MEFKLRERMVENAHRYLQAAYILANTGMERKLGAGQGFQLALGCLNQSKLWGRSNLSVRSLIETKGHKAPAQTIA